MKDKLVKRNEIKRAFRDTFRSPIMIFFGTVLLLYVIFFLILLFWGFSTSLKASLRIEAINPENLYDDNRFGFPVGWPWQWQWKNYSTIFSHLVIVEHTRGADGRLTRITEDFFGMIKNTMFYCVGGALIQTLVPCVVAYATAKTNYKFSKFYDAVILIVMVIPIIGSGPSMLQVLNTLHLYDSLIGYYIMHAHTITVYYLIFQAIFRSIPYTYSEAAYIEGAGEYTVMLRVVMPLARTVIVTVFLIHFISIWNDYNTPMIYTPSYPSLAYGIYFLSFSSSNAIQAIVYKMAGSYLLFTPILVLFIFFRKLIMQNLSMGGLKE